MDTYISREILVPEGDEDKILTQEELGQGQEDHGWFSHGSTYTTSVFLKNTKDVWFLDQAIWREEHTSEDDLKKQLKNVKIQNVETMQSYFTGVSQIKEQLEAVKEEVKNAEVVMATLNGLPGSWDSFMRGNVFQKEVITFSKL